MLSSSDVCHPDIVGPLRPDRRPGCRRFFFFFGGGGRGSLHGVAWYSNRDICFNYILLRFDFFAVGSANDGFLL